MQKEKIIKIPAHFAYQLQQYDSTVPKLFYFTIFTPSPQTGYILALSPQKPTSLPLTLQSHPVLTVLQHQLTPQSKPQILQQYPVCPCSELNQIIQKYMIIGFNIEGYRGLPLELKGFRIGSVIRGKGKGKGKGEAGVVGVDGVGELLGILKEEVGEIWGEYNRRYCRTLGDRKKEGSGEITCGLQSFLSFEVECLAAFNFADKKVRRIEELESYFERVSFLLPNNPDTQISDLSTKIIQILTQKLHQNSQSLSQPLVLNTPIFSSPRAHPTKLFNPHLHARLTKKQKYELITVKGMYEYYHYGDQGFTDNGWGCAYRALQTLISWLHIQGHTPPMERMWTIGEIQEKLDQFDRSRKLKGSSTWIGATQISWLVPSLTTQSLNCKILHISDGKQILEKCPQLSSHFLTSGSPIMYGGGEYAYTIVGMHYNWKFGECEFLILDPHYTGEDEFGRILEKKGLVWRRPEEMFKVGVFYNFCLPLVK